MPRRSRVAFPVVAQAITVVMHENACGPRVAASRLHRSATEHKLRMTDVATAIVHLASAAPIQTTRA